MSKTEVILKLKTISIKHAKGRFRLSLTDSQDLQKTSRVKCHKDTSKTVQNTLSDIIMACPFFKCCLKKSLGIPKAKLMSSLVALKLSRGVNLAASILVFWR